MSKASTINVIEIIAAVLEMSIADLNMDSSMLDTPKWDSLAHMNIVSAIEKELACELELDDIASAISIKNFHNIISKYTVGN
tara:strand:+ start:165 stop:410 length:246 start_codon:yes stop_codon:yes gene_type:complete